MTKNISIWDQIKQIKSTQSGQTETLADIEARAQARIEDRRRERARMQAQREAEQRRIDDEGLSETHLMYSSRTGSIVASSQATLKKIRETRLDCQKRMDSCQSALDALNETEQKYNDLNDKFDQLMRSHITQFCLGDSALASIVDKASEVRRLPEPIHELQQTYGAPQQCSDTEIAEKISQTKSVCIIVGADVSAISTNVSYDMASITSVFQNQLIDIWRQQHSFKSQMHGCTPNAVHHAVAQLVHFFNSTNRSGYVISENIDGLDWASSLGGEVFEIHGNLDYMRCNKQCSQNLYPSRLSSVAKIKNVPTCPKCRAPCRPHILKHGEKYTEKYYKSETAEEMFRAADLLIVLGSQLDKSLPKKCAQMAQKSNKLILECNTTPQLHYGKVIVNSQPLIESFPGIVEKIVASSN